MPLEIVGRQVLLARTGAKALLVGVVNLDHLVCLDHLDQQVHVEKMVNLDREV